MASGTITSTCSLESIDSACFSLMRMMPFALRLGPACSSLHLLAIYQHAEAHTLTSPLASGMLMLPRPHHPAKHTRNVWHTAGTSAAAWHLRNMYDAGLGG